MRGPSVLFALLAIGCSEAPTVERAAPVGGKADAVALSAFDPASCPASGSTLLADLTALLAEGETLDLGRYQLETRHHQCYGRWCEEWRPGIRGYRWDPWANGAGGAAASELSGTIELVRQPDRVVLRLRPEPLRVAGASCAPEGAGLTCWGVDGEPGCNTYGVETSLRWNSGSATLECFAPPLAANPIDQLHPGASALWFELEVGDGCVRVFGEGRERSQPYEEAQAAAVIRF